MTAVEGTQRSEDRTTQELAISTHRPVDLRPGLPETPRIQVDSIRSRTKWRKASTTSAKLPPPWFGTTSTSPVRGGELADTELASCRH
jgi:hypothetical protein